MPRSHRLTAWRETRELRRAVRVRQLDSAELVVSVHGELGALQITRVGTELAELVAYGPRTAHFDLADTSVVVGIGDAFIKVWASAQPRLTQVVVHRATV